MSFSLIIGLAELFIIGVMYPFYLYKNYRHEKFELSKLYVSFLLIPSPVSKMIKAFAGTIEQVLEYDNNVWFFSLDKEQCKSKQKYSLASIKLILKANRRQKLEVKLIKIPSIYILSKVSTSQITIF